jgi:LacI family transcriptional regulator
MRKQATLKDVAQAAGVQGDTAIPELLEDGVAIVLVNRPRPTAILAANDLLAIGAYRAAAARGLEVPRDVSIVGFNDMPFVDQFRPPLTTVRIPHRELGRRAAGLLLAALDTASSRGDPPQGKVRLPVELIERNSASSPPRKS